MVKTKIGVLVSGGGTNLQALMDACACGIIKSGRIALVISSNKRAYALKRAEEAGIRAEAVDRKEAGSQKKFEERIESLLREEDIDMIVMAGFMSILTKDFTDRYPDRIINIHPSLIPSFCGKGYYGLKVHEAALDYGVKVTGATVHFVNEVPDGGRIIMQKAVEVKDGDTPEILQRRVMEEAEWKILPAATELIAAKIASDKAGTKQEAANTLRGDSMKTIRECIGANPYPGRGIIIGTAPDGRAVTGYFISGRSQNSRNRIFASDGRGDIFTRPFDESKVEDPSLIIYRAVAHMNDCLIVTNGDQTDTMAEYIMQGKSAADALKTREYEPDAPNYTSRISGLIRYEDGSYQISILKAAGAGDDLTCDRFFYEYEPVLGKGQIIHTYEGDGNPLPAFCGEPREIKIEDNIDDMTGQIWDSLNEDNRISLYVSYRDLKTGAEETRLINKNK